MCTLLPRLAARETPFATSSRYQLYIKSVQNDSRRPYSLPAALTRRIAGCVSTLAGSASPSGSRALTTAGSRVFRDLPAVSSFCSVSTVICISSPCPPCISEYSKYRSILVLFAGQPLATVFPRGKLLEVSSCYKTTSLPPISPVSSPLDPVCLFAGLLLTRIVSCQRRIAAQVSLFPRRAVVALLQPGARSIPLTPTAMTTRLAVAVAVAVVARPVPVVLVLGVSHR